MPSARCTRAVPFALAAVAASATGLRAQTVFSSSGANPGAIQATVDAFRTAVGTLNPNTPGSFPSGRREVNWDGVPAALRNPHPGNFFNVNSPRGVVSSTPGSALVVSGDPGTPTDRFADFNPTYAQTFQTFSAPRLFAAIGSNVVDVNFFVPGSTVGAATSAFGVIFTDVDLANQTSVQFFDVFGASLGTYFAGTANTGLSFLGVQFATASIGRVRITSGNTALGPTDGGTVDVVAMDDFIYAEPQQVIPEPSTWALLGTGLATVAAVGRRRRATA